MSTPCVCLDWHDGSACLCGCHVRYQGRDGWQELHPDEIADLAILAARRRDAERVIAGDVPATRTRMVYVDDLRPMTREGEAIPWAVVVAGVTAY